MPAPRTPAVEKKPVVVTVKKPVSDPDKQSAEEPPSVRATDDFGLPLVIVPEAPKVPKEIRGPSPPIEEEPEEALKKNSGWW